VTPAIPERYRRALFAILVVVVMVTPGLLVPAQAGAPRAAETRFAQDAPHAPGESDDAHDSGGWDSTIAKGINFLALAGLLAYFLKAPIAGYLRNRHETIRKGLTDAAALRASAEQQLTDVRARLTALPAEIDGLRRRGREELAGERVRMAEATAREKQRVLERTRREIDLQFRVARRRLLEHAAELSIARARARITRDITSEDQARLIERYAAEVRP
jgi:F-type H+-transporting ATPase subunit b